MTKAINIHFLSDFIQMDNADKVDFKATGTITTKGSKKVLFFKEPAQNVETTITYDNETASIDTAHSILKFKLNEIVKNELKTQHGNFAVYTHLNKLINSDNQIFFEYKLSNEAKEEIGYFKITINFK